jgi:hypothetical protein
VAQAFDLASTKNTVGSGTGRKTRKAGPPANPSDYTLNSNPTSTPFNYVLTNTTISSAGHTGQPTPATIPETLPTYSFTNTQF